MNTTTDLTTILANITPEMVRKTYRGRPGCMCGCKGTYKENNRRSASHVLRFFKEKLAEGDDGFSVIPYKGEVIVSFDRDERTTVMYAKAA